MCAIDIGISYTYYDIQAPSNLHVRHEIIFFLISHQPSVVTVLLGSTMYILLGIYFLLIVYL